MSEIVLEICAVDSCNEEWRRKCVRCTTPYCGLHQDHNMTRFDRQLYCSSCLEDLKEELNNIGE